MKKKTIWIYEALEREDYLTKTEIKPFATEKAARDFFDTKKKEILATTDCDYYTVEIVGNSLILIYDKENSSETFWHYSIKEYPIEGEEIV